MNQHWLRTIFLEVMVAALSLAAAAQNCSRAPSGFGSAWWNEYAKWCSQCGGTPNVSNNSCTPGPNWGKGPGSSSVNSSVNSAVNSAASGAAYQAGYQLGQGIGKMIFGDPAEKLRAEQDQQRVMQSLDQISREQSAAQEQLLQNMVQQARLLDDRNRQEALSSFNGIPQPGELELRPTTNFFGVTGNPQGATTADSLKDGPADTPQAAAGVPPCQWGDQGSSVVDLRCLGLDPDKPIAIDPWVVRGQERVFPAQIDPATFENANYNNGFLALMRPTFSVKDAMDAVAYFQVARLQRPNDPLVHNGLLLAQDIMKLRQQKQLDDKAQAEQQLDHAVAALMMGDVRTASDSVERAQKLDPVSGTIGSWSRLMMGLDSNYKKGNRLACQLVGNALVFEATGETKSEIRTLETAAHMFPNDSYIRAMLWRAQHLNPAHPDFSSVAPGAVTKYPPGTTLKPDDSASAAPPK